MSILDFNPKVIPLIKNGKKPAQKYRNRAIPFNLEKTIMRASKGEINVGLLMAPTFLAIDIDTLEGHADDGINNFIDWCKKNKLDYNRIFDETLVQKSPTGSIHLIYLTNPAYEFTQDIEFLPGVDIKASKNNYILLAPSQIDGKRYKLIDPNKDPIEIPDDLAEAIIKQQEKNSRKTKRALENGGITDTGLKYTKAFSNRPYLDVFYTIKHGFGLEGSRNINLFRWAGTMRLLTDLETTLEYAKIANQNMSNPLDETELINSVKSAFNYTRHPEIKEINGYKWVSLENRVGDRFAVLEETFYKHNGSFDVADYKFDPDNLLETEVFCDSMVNKPSVYDYPKVVELKEELERMHAENDE